MHIILIKNSNPKNMLSQGTSCLTAYIISHSKVVSLPNAHRSEVFHQISGSPNIYISLSTTVPRLNVRCDCL
uniref:Uncharacterized protein n=1 Tax=Arundo donax TaxID=35708 RepID=A0A0A9FSX2_ARUDO